MAMQIMINLPQIFIWPIRPYNVSLYQIWTYLDQWKQSCGPLEPFLSHFLPLESSESASSSDMVQQGESHRRNQATAVA